MCETKFGHWYTPSRRPLLQPTFSLDSVSAPPTPPPPHHCHQNQRFASQLSLCIGSSHPPSPCISSHPPTPPLCSPPLKFSHHFPSSGGLEPHSSSCPSSTCYKYSLLNPESNSHPSLLFQAQTMYSSPLTYSDSLSNDSCPHKTNCQANVHMLSSSLSNSHPWNFSPLLSQTSLYCDSLPCSMSSVCPYTPQNIQSKSNSNPETPPLPRFHPDRQTNPNAPHQPDSNTQTKHPAVQSCGRPQLVPPHAEKALPVFSAFSLSSTHRHLPSTMSSLPVTTNKPCSAMSKPLEGMITK
ncbi:uncharacterized protein LOC142380525 [Odontesthes bonariensis]|uniref:uncharacterized protein LOC142380525 n=1 Tax=Odontesthes bonariensis TaxID=219752 RepID=UPI003F58CE1E